MTKKDFELIAKVLHKDITTADQYPKATHSQILKAQALQFAFVLAKQNERFDRSRFLTACGLEPNEIANNRVNKA